MAIADDFWKASPIDEMAEQARTARRALREKLNRAMVDSLVTGEPAKRLHLELDKIFADTHDVPKS